MRNNTYSFSLPLSPSLLSVGSVAQSLCLFVIFCFFCFLPTSGLLITLADLGLKRVGLHGPGPLRHFLQAARNVSVRSGMVIEANEVPREQEQEQHNGESDSNTTTTSATKPFFEDANISVEAVVLAEQRVCLPPLRTLHSWPQQQAAAQAQAQAAVLDNQANNNSAAAAIIEPVDSSIDDSVANGVHVPPVAELPPSKRAKRVHNNNNNDVEQGAAAAAAASSAAAESTSATAAPAAAVSSQAPSDARQPVEWTSSVQPALAAYIVRLASVPGKFDVNKARTLGIPPGPLYAKLKNGESVTLRASEMIGAPGVGAKKKAKQLQKNQKGGAASAAAAAPVADTPTASDAPASADDPVRTFHPSDCVAVTTPGAVFALVDCPNRAFVPAITEHRAFARFQHQQESPQITNADAPSVPSTSHLSVLVHFTPLSILSLPAYKTWMHSFPPSSTQHVLVHASTSVPRAVFRSAALNYLKLQRYVNAEVFPAAIPVLVDEAPVEEADADVRELNAKIAALFPKPMQVHPGQALLRFQLAPPQNQCMDASGVVGPVRFPSDVEANLSEGSTPALTARLQKWKKRMDEQAAQLGVAKVAEQLRVEFEAEDAAAEAAAAADGTMSDAAAVAASPAAAPEDFPSDLVSAAPSSFASSASSSTASAEDVLSLLSAEPEHLSPELVFLGTGSAIPSKYRNVTGQFFHPGYVAPAPESVSSSSPLPPHPVGGMFFDCGEGSYGQLCLRYAGLGLSAADNVVSDLVADLKAIWLSHIHADHHLGLLTLLALYKRRWTERYRAKHGASAPLARMHLVSPWHPDAGSDHRVPRLLVIGPRRCFWWLKEYAAAAFEVDEEDDVELSPTVTATTDAMVDDTAAAAASSATQQRRSPRSPRTLFDWVEFVNCSEVQDRSNRLSSFFARDAPAAVRLYPHLRTRSVAVLHTVQVKHCNDAYGLVVETTAETAVVSQPQPQPAYKLVISGDTQPCQALVDAGADATLLVHESTLEDDMVAEALAKRHSTTRQAVQVGLAMRAKRILLTHFSQRYPKLPTASSARSGSSSSSAAAGGVPSSLSRTAIAFDLLSLRFRSLGWLPSLTPAFGFIFSDTELKKYENSAAAAAAKEKEEMAEFV
jgi:ribonuclease Z